MSKSNSLPLSPVAATIVSRRATVIIEILEHARCLASDEDETVMAGYIENAIRGCREHHIADSRRKLVRSSIRPAR